VCASLLFSLDGIVTHPLTRRSPFERLTTPTKRTSRHLIHLPARIHSRRRNVSVQTRRTPIRHPPAPPPNVSLRGRGVEDHQWQPHDAANRRLLRRHKRTAVRARSNQRRTRSRCQSRSWSRSQSPAVSRQRVDAYHPERAPGTGRTHAQDRPCARRLCPALGNAPARVLFSQGEERRGGGARAGAGAGAVAAAGGNREARRDAVCAGRWAHARSARMGERRRRGGLLGQRRAGFPTLSVFFVFQPKLRV